MLFQLGARNVRDPATTPDGLAELLACHERIRSFTAMAERLAQATGAAPSLVAEAARDVARYHSIALPLHAEDEDLSLAPRMRDAGAPRELLDALEQIAREHGELDTILAGAIPRWDAVAEDPSRLDALRDALLRDVQALQAFWRRHLDLEERVVFPAAQRILPPRALGEIRAEIAARRNERLAR